MVRSARIFSAGIMLALAGMMALAGCTSTTSRLMVEVPEPAVIATPPSDKATIVFYRSSYLGEAIQASVFDISTEPPRLVGIVSASTKLAYICEPGRRRFMVISESADFMDAELAAGKTYFTLVAPRVGVWKARFSLRPRVATDPETIEQLSGLSWIDNTPRSQHWAEVNMSSIQQKREDYWPQWQRKRDKPLLGIDDGR